MSNAFLKIVNMSLAAGGLVLIVLLARLLLKKAPKWISCLLWVLVAVRLVCPVAIESSFSLMPSLFSNTDTLSEWTSDRLKTEWVFTESPEELWQLEGTAISSEGVTDYYLPPMEKVPDSTAETGRMVLSVLSWIWCAGIVLMLGYMLCSYVRLGSKIKTAVPLRDNIYQSEAVTLPFVLGILKPRIYIPFSMKESAMNSVLLHEQAHIMRRDHLSKFFAFLLLSVYWFHPLCWLAYVLFCRDMELACDERVIKNFSKEKCADYSEALLSCSVPRKRIAACPLAFGETGLKQRVKNVLGYKKPAVWILALALLSCVVLAVCFLTNPKPVYLTERFSLPPEEKVDAVEQVVITNPKLTFSVSDREQIKKIFSALETVTVSKRKLSDSRSEERPKDYAVVINCDVNYMAFYFDEDLSEVWVDDGVKPSFSYAVTEMDKAGLLSCLEWFNVAEYLGIPGVDKAETEFLLDETYVSFSCLYMNPLSSYLAVNGDSGFRYTFEDNVFRMTPTKNTEIFREESIVLQEEWGWREFPYTDAEWNEMFIMPRLSLENPSTLYEEMRYQPLNDRYFLLQMDGELWLVELHEDRTGKYIWSIYTLVPENYSVVELGEDSLEINGE